MNNTFHTERKVMPNEYSSDSERSRRLDTKPEYVYWPQKWGYDLNNTLKSLDWFHYASWFPSMKAGRVSP